MSVSCPDECFKIDMGCNCPPNPPDRPTPYMFSWLDGQTGPRTDATITFQAVAGIITGYTILNPGSAYRVAPLITIVGTGTGALATCTINTVGQITSVTITNGGTGYGLTSTCTLAKGTSNQILLDDLTFLKVFGAVHSEVMLGFRMALSVPYGLGVTLASAKVQMILSYTIETNGVTDFTGTFYLNGTPIASTLKVDDTSATYTKVTHYSGEISLTNVADAITYKISSTESKLKGLKEVAGVYTVKLI